jgi:hypothetical protein
MSNPTEVHVERLINDSRSIMDRLEIVGYLSSESEAIKDRLRVLAERFEREAQAANADVLRSVARLKEIDQEIIQTLTGER